MTISVPIARVTNKARVAGLSARIEKQVNNQTSFSPQTRDVSAVRGCYDGVFQVSAVMQFNEIRFPNSFVNEKGNIKPSN
jgi:hypothetical protein